MIQHQEPVWLLQVNYMLSNQQQKQNSPKTTDSWSDRFTSEGRVASRRHVSALECVMQLVRRVTGNVWENINWVKITKQSDGVIDFFLFLSHVLSICSGKIVWNSSALSKTHFPASYLDMFLQQSGQKSMVLVVVRQKKKKKKIPPSFSLLVFISVFLTYTPPHHHLLVAQTFTDGHHDWTNRDSLLIYKYWFDPSITSTWENPS